MKTVRIGCGAGYSGDRLEPAIEIAREGDIQYLVFECLAERTIALAQQAKLDDPDTGYDELLLTRMRAVLPLCHERGIRIITNMGAANPTAAARATVKVARELGLHGLKVVAITGDDVLESVAGTDMPLLESGLTVAALRHRLVSANAYLGAEPIVMALQEGADVVVTGRAADPSLFLAPLVYEFGWSFDDWEKMGQATLFGHLLECGGQVTGGYFADPGRKTVPRLEALGFPIAQVYADGSGFITKVPGSGGRLDIATCTEQLLYEVHDPSAYVTPDVIADFSGVRFQQIGPDQVAVSGASGRERPTNLKVSLGYKDGYIGEGQISYAGPGAIARGRLAIEIVQARLKRLCLTPAELRCDLIGLDSIYPSTAKARAQCCPDEIRVRIAARTDTAEQAVMIGREVDTLYTNGPAGGGGVSRQVRNVLAIASILMPRDLVQTVIHSEVA